MTDQPIADTDNTRFLCPAHSHLTMQEYAELTGCFKCIHDEYRARDEEVRRLREELSEVRQNYYEVVEQRNALVSDNKRLREALAELLEAIDEYTLNVIEHRHARHDQLSNAIDKATDTLKARGPE